MNTKREKQKRNNGTEKMFGKTVANNTLKLLNGINLQIKEANFKMIIQIKPHIGISEPKG